jgi:hypothetical protein
MTPFLPAEELKFLEGYEVSNITLQPYWVDISFVEGPLLVIELGLEYFDTKGLIHARDPQHRLGPGPITFHALIGDRVTQVETGGYRMTLTFDSGRKLVVLSDDGPYEAGHIHCAAYDERGVLKGLGIVVF